MQSTGKQPISGILSKFENGEERFKVDPLFRQIILQLNRGDDPIDLLDEVLQNAQKTRNILLNIIELHS